MTKAKWIWHESHNTADGYVLFRDAFTCRGKGAALKISVDGTYEAFVNGTLAAFGQYADYPYHKVYDEIDLTPFLAAGENELVVRVWYLGDGNMTYYPGDAGLYYEVFDGSGALAVSDEGTLCAVDPCYVSGNKKLITSQLGYSYCYDARGLSAALVYSRAVPVPERPLFHRPVKKLTTKRLHGKLVDENRQIYDMGCETTGYLFLRMRAKAGETVTVAYGEHLADGQVRRLIGARDFSVTLIGNGEYFDFSNHLRRLGGRYLQIKCASPVEVEYIGIDEAIYPLRVLPFDTGSPLRQSIYDTAVRTLRLCMHEHYEDCPWREQALYALDSRNQMLYGYHAFGEYAFPRANLKLFALERRTDGQVAICSPTGQKLCIPFFTLAYCVAACEYVEHSGDTTLFMEDYARIRGGLDAFLSRERKGGLVVSFYGDKDYWNFYEWSDDLAGKCLEADDKKVELALNAYLSLALQKVAAVARTLHLDADAKGYESAAKELNEAINSHLYRAEEGLYINRDGGLYSELANALAILCGAADGERAKRICERIAAGSVPVKATLSMQGFVYDALLKVDKARYADYILGKIDADFGYMLSRGATSFWETIEGEAAFENAGSLCHGWSALPVYYYRLLLK